MGSLLKAATISSFFGFLLLLFLRCSGSSSLESATEIAAGVLAGAAYSTEGGSYGAELRIAPSSRFAWGISALKFLEIPTALASGTCASYDTSGSVTCSAGSYPLSYSSCSFTGSTAIWNGSLSLLFNPTSNCGTVALPIHTNSQSVQRTFTNGTTRRGTNGLLVTLSHASSGWYSAVGGGLSAAGNGSGRDLVLTGLNLSSSRFNYTVSTQTQIAVVGTGAFKTISTGSLNVQDNRNSYLGLTTITSQLTFSSNCCHPTGGQLSTNFTQGTTGTETLTFSSTCGRATHVSTTGESSSVTLAHCF